jgi:hypothetical protein
MAREPSSEALVLLLDESFVLVMRTDPNPDEIHAVLYCQCPMMRTGPHRPKLANLFEM